MSAQGQPPEQTGRLLVYTSPVPAGSRPQTRSIESRDPRRARIWRTFVAIPGSLPAFEGQSLEPGVRRRGARRLRGRGARMLRPAARGRLSCPGGCPHGRPDRSRRACQRAPWVASFGRAHSRPRTRAFSPTARWYRASATVRSANAVRPSSAREAVHSSRRAPSRRMRACSGPACPPVPSRALPLPGEHRGRAPSAPCCEPKQNGGCARRCASASSTAVSDREGPGGARRSPPSPAGRLPDPVAPRGHGDPPTAALGQREPSPPARPNSTVERPRSGGRRASNNPSATSSCCADASRNVSRTSSTRGRRRALRSGRRGRCRAPARQGRTAGGEARGAREAARHEGSRARELRGPGPKLAPVEGERPVEEGARP